MKGLITPWETRQVRHHLQIAVGIRHGSEADNLVGELLSEAIGGEYEVMPREGYLVLETRKVPSALTTYGDQDGLAPKIEVMSASLVTGTPIPVKRSLVDGVIVTTVHFSLCLAYN